MLIYSDTTEVQSSTGENSPLLANLNSSFVQAVRGSRSLLPLRLVADVCQGHRFPEDRLPPPPLSELLCGVDVVWDGR